MMISHRYHYLHRRFAKSNALTLQGVDIRKRRVHTLSFGFVIVELCGLAKKMLER